MVSGRTLILAQMKEAADELSALKLRVHGASRGKRRRLRKQAAEIEGRMSLLVSDLLEAQRSEKRGA